MIAFPPYLPPVLYADPGWKYDRGPGARGASDKHYLTMSTRDLERLPVRERSEKDALLFLWATWPMLPDALRVGAAWGYTFKTCAFLWIKVNQKTPMKAVPPCVEDGIDAMCWIEEELFLGLGHYTRANTEPCLLFRRGNGVPIVDRSVPQVVITPRGRHSAKPAEVRCRIELLTGDQVRMELFARERTPGWMSWGVEV